jgi:hypothetical protein
MGHDATLKLGLIVEKEKEKATLQAKVRSYRDAISFQFFKHPFDLECIDIEAVRNLNDELLKCLDRYRVLCAEIEELKG